MNEIINHRISKIHELINCRVSKINKWIWGDVYE